MTETINLEEKFALFSEYWSPKIVGEVNDFLVKLVKLQGEFVWHHHDDEDELFFVAAGTMRMQFRDGDKDVGPGELIIVPRGVEHCPRSLTDDVHVMLLEPKTTVNTGNVRSDRTLATLERI